MSKLKSVLICHHEGAQACAAGQAFSQNPYRMGSVPPGSHPQQADAWDTGWREQAAHERAARRLELADDYGDCVNDPD